MDYIRLIKKVLLVYVVIHGVYGVYANLLIDTNVDCYTAYAMNNNDINESSTYRKETNRNADSKSMTTSVSSHRDNNNLIDNHEEESLSVITTNHIDPIKNRSRVDRKNTVQLSVKDASLSDVVRGIAREYKMNIIGIETLDGTVTAQIKGANGIDILRQLGMMQHFIVKEKNQMIIVDGRGMGNNIEKDILLIKPVHLRPESIKASVAGIVGDEGMTIVPETNQLVVYGTAQERQQVETVIQMIDEIPKQVQLEAIVVAIENSYVREVGLRWSWANLLGRSQNISSGDGSIHFKTDTTRAANKFFINPELRAMENSGRAVIVARPSIVTMNGEEASILIGEKIPVLEDIYSDGGHKASVRYEESGIRLYYKPYILEDGMVDATISAEVSNPVMVSEMKAYKISTRQAKTRVRMKPGDVLIIGGLMDHRKGTQIEKIPLLGDIPLLGNLFKHSRKTNDKVELMILVKATIL